MQNFDLFDAVRVVGLPEGRSEKPAYYSQTGTTHVKIGDIGVVIDEWPGNKLRVEAVRDDGAIDWQDHFLYEQLEVVPVTAARYSRRRINEHWAGLLGTGKNLLRDERKQEALTLLSYLREAFKWSGFPGFEYLADAPTDMLRELRQGLVRL